MIRAVHHLIRGIILIALALYIVYLVNTGNLVYYIAPRMVPYVKITALLFYVVSVHQFYAFIMSIWKKNHVSCWCSHIPENFSFKSILMYTLFIFPLILGLMLPDEMLASAMADQKGMRLSATSSIPEISQQRTTRYAETLNNKPDDTTSKETEAPTEAMDYNEDEQEVRDQNQGQMNIPNEELEDLFPYDLFTEIYAKYAMSIYNDELIRVEEESFTEILTTLDLYLDAFIGKQVEITGFVYRTDEMNDQQFAVGRFAMTCCSADAAPYGVFSEFAAANQYKDDEWVTVKGTIGKTVFNEMEIMKIDVTSIKRSEASEEPYVYPNFEFGQDL